jgi:hypothetical protein
VPRPPAATFELHSGVGLAEEYTDNFDLTARNRRDNLRSSLSPSATALINSPFTKGQLTLSLTGAHDTATGKFNFFPSFDGVVTWDVSPLLRLTAADSLSRSDERARADTLGLRSERSTFTTNTFSLSADYLIGNIATREYYRLATFFNEGNTTRTGTGDTIAHTLGATAGTTFATVNTASVGYEFLLSSTDGADTTGHQVTASVARQLSELASAGISASHAIRTGSGESTSAGGRFGGNGDFTISSVSLFSSYGIPGRWSLAANVGYSLLRRDGGGDENLITTASTFTYFFARATATLSVDQGFSETFAETENRGVVQTRGVVGTLIYPVTPFITGTLSAYFRQNDLSTTSGGTEDNKGASIALSIQLLRWLRMGLEYAYTDRSSSRQTAISSDFTENRARVSLLADF